MCEAISKAAHMAVSRRQLLGGAGAASAAAAFAVVFGSATAQASPSREPGGDPDAGKHRTRLVLLGTAGGPVWWPATEREGIGSAVVVDGDVYVIDFGDGSARRFKQAALVPRELRTPGGLWGEERLRAMFITHLHSDHVADYFNYVMFGWTKGLQAGPIADPIHGYGPGRRVDDQGNVVMEPIFRRPGEPTPTVPVENPENPVPGTVDMTNYLFQAFALDINDR